MNEPRELILLSEASRALEQARTVDEVKDLRDKAEAVKAYARKAKLGHSIVVEASLIKVSAERKLGEMLQAAELAKAAPGNQYTGKVAGNDTPPTLEQLGISKSDSSRLQKIAGLPDTVFQKYLDDSTASQKEPTTAGLLRIADQQSTTSRDKSRENQHSEPVGRITNSSANAVADLDMLIREGRRFSTIYADPPWPYSNQGTRAATSKHYPTMSVDSISDEPIPQLLTEQAHLHLWTTNGFLLEAFDVIEAWGFEYKSCLVWVKPQMGIGNYWRVSHEYCLLGVRGGLTFADRSQRSWIEEPRTKHSRKPDSVRQMIEQVSQPDYLELYGRQATKGWTVYGNEF